MKMAYARRKAPGRRDQDHLTVIVPVGGVLVTFNVTEPSDSNRAYFVFILPLASEKNALGPCFLPPLIFARYFSSAAGSGAFCWIAFFPIADRVAFMRCTARDGLAFLVVVDSFCMMSCLRGASRSRDCLCSFARRVDSRAVASMASR